MKLSMPGKRKISDSSKIASLMRRNLETELGIIRFYESNLHLFKDPESRAEIKGLVLASLRHASMFIEEIHRMHDTAKQPRIKLPSNTIARKNALFTLEGAMREEAAAEEIYKHQAARMSEQTAAGTLLDIAKDEKMHQETVKSIARQISKGLPEKKAAKILRKLRLN